MTLRVTTNLVAPATLQLPRIELKKNFLYVYNRGFREKPMAFMQRFWLGSVFPEVVKSDKYGTDARDIRKVMEVFHKKTPAGLTRLQKINDAADPHFTVSVPLWSVNSDNIAGGLENLAAMLARGVLSEDNPDQDKFGIDNLMEKTVQNPSTPDTLGAVHYTKEKVIASMGNVNAAGLAALQSCLVSVTFEHSANRGVFFATFKITKAEAEQLTTTNWMEIRNIDLYPLMLQWTTSGFGQQGSNPLSSFPISKIARTLPPVESEDARVDEYGLSIDPAGMPIYLPYKLDNTSKYENLFSLAGSYEGDDSFALHRLDPTGTMETLSKETHLPRNVPVLIDWVNNKYAFTQTTGMLKVLDLVRYKKAQAPHIINMMKRDTDIVALFTRFLPMAETAGIGKSVEPTEAELQAIKAFDPVAYESIKASTHGLTEYLATVKAVIDRMDEDPILNLTHITPHSEYPAFQCLSRWCVNAQAAIIAQLDSVYARYSVSHVASNLAWLTIIAKYGPKFPETQAVDETIRKAAINQAVDAAWEIPSIPLFRKENIMLPHQKKVRNLLKDSPDFAILPVQAGGGKSVLTITDILYEIKANRSEPYLILCPPHLVAQYVKEIVFFTDGKLNAIPINTYTVRKNGLERLGKILQSAPRNTVVIADYDVLRYRQQQVCYGTTNVNVYPIIEFLRQFKFGYSMLDESHCFLAGTEVDTPSGIRKIEDINVGDSIYSAIGISKVQATHALPLNTDIIEVAYNGKIISATTKHPFFTKRGWIFAKDLVVGDEIVCQIYAEELLNEVQVLPTGICSKEFKNEESKVLRDILLSEMEDVSAKNSSKDSHLGELCEGYGNQEEEREEKSRDLQGRSSSELSVYEGKQSYEGSQDSCESIFDVVSNRSRICETRRQRDDKSLRTVSDEHVSESDISAGHTYETAKGLRVSSLLQSGLCVAETKVSLGSERLIPLYVNSTAFRCKKEETSKFLRVDSVKRIEQSSYQSSEGSAKVYNLQIDGHPSFSVNGGLVHNSVKNDSARTKACMALIADIPKKRLASGTMAHDSPSDLALQIAMLDPTLFGSRDAFNERFGEKVSGNRVLKWKPGAQQQISEIIKTRVVVAGAMRKEWAALLPQAIEKFHRVDLTEAQREIYNLLFERTIEAIKEAAKTSPRLAEFINGGKSKVEPKGEGEEDPGDESADDEDADEDLAGILGPYLARLEQFITAPTSDELGDKVLKGEDRISPKVHKIHELIREHIEQQIPGKVLVFTNYTASAEEIYNLLPNDLKAKAILYVAADKIEAGAAFEHDESKQIMIGVEQSMNTGLNLQHASRLVRCFPGQTPVLIDYDKSLTIKEIVDNPDIKYVLSYDLENKRIEKRRILTRWKTPVQPDDEYVSVTVEDSITGQRSSIVSTSVHPFILKGGEEVLAANLKKGQKLITYGGDFTRFKVDVNSEVIPYDSVGDWSCPKCDFIDHPNTKHNHLYESHGILSNKSKQVMANRKKAALEASNDTVRKGKARLESFINNHYLKVIHVQRNRNVNTIGKYRYDLEVEGNHNYFAVTTHNQGGRSGYVPITPVLVHNCETVWNPGTLEQGNSRVNRPELKKESRRTKIYFDWVMADRTIDITKISRLISKLIANAKFENADNTTYESIPDVPVMKMTLDTVQEHNDWGNPDDLDSNSTLAIYGNAYSEYRQCLYDDYKEYREIHGDLKIETVEIAPVPKDARLMHTVPYTPGLEIYGTDQLGLVRMDDYLRLDALEGDEEEDQSPEDAKATEQESFKRIKEELSGQVVHTEFGEGTIRAFDMKARFVKVDLPSGFIWVKFSSTFLITRKDTSTNDIRTQILKGTGDLPIDAPVDHPAVAVVQDAKNVRLQKQQELDKLKKDKVKQKKDLEKAMSVELALSVINGFLSLSYFIDEKNSAASNALQSLGFTIAQQFYYAPITNAQRLEKQLKLWAEKGFMPDPKMKELKEAFGAVHTMLQKGKSTPNLIYKFASVGQLRNFYRVEQKPSSDPKIIKPYPLLENGHAYLVLPAHGQAGTNKAIRAKAPGIKWALSEPVLMYFGLTMPKLIAIANKIKEAGIQVSNEKDLNKMYNKLRRTKLRDVSEEM